jgi:ATP-binding cassette subfamily C (CFTR/MRP) protein 4
VNLEEKIFNYTVANATNSTEDEELQQQRTKMFYMYSFMTVATAVTSLGRVVGLLLFGRSAAMKLHKYMISTIVNASMRFFDTNFIGNILNRFSKDLTTVDDAIPFAFYHVFRVSQNDKPSG